MLSQIMKFLLELLLAVVLMVARLTMMKKMLMGMMMIERTRTRMRMRMRRRKKMMTMTKRGVRGWHR